MQAARPTPWPSILLFALSCFSLVVFFSTGFLTGIAGLIELASGDAQNAESTLMLAMGSFVLGLTLLPAAYYSFMHILNKPARSLPLHKIPTIALIVLWIAIISLALSLTGKEASPLLMVPLNVVALTLPVWILIRLGLRGLDSGPDEKRWGIFAVGITIVPIFIGIVEVLLILAALIAAVIGLALNPSSLNSLEALSARLMYTNNPDAILRMIAPFLFKPATLLAGLIFFSILVPIVEEIIKPLGVWLTPGGITSPKQGFALGVLGGAAFALVESLGMSPGIPGTSNILPIVRAGTDVVHIVTTGLMGWALVSAWQGRKYLQLGITYLVVIAIHGLWNALALSSATQIALDYLPNPSRWMESAPLVSSIGLVTLTIINMSILLLANRRLNSRD